jgi:2-isopropylmalate synthase
MSDYDYLSPFNKIPEVRRHWTLPREVILSDVTLREGEQGSEALFSADEKVKMALRLDHIGIRQVEIGWPGRSATDREVLRRLKDKGIRAKTQALVQIYQTDWQWQIDATLDSGADILALLHPTSELRLTHTEKMTHREVISKCQEAIRYARNRGALIVFTPTDVTRTDLDFLKQILTAAVEAGADRIQLPDTVGVTLPAAYAFLVSQVVNTVSVPVHVHCHNDFGLALANTLAAVEAGATIVDAAVNGLGERAGNAALAEVAVALEVMYGLPTGVRLEELYALSREVEALSGIPLSASMPLVGDNAFVHKLDVHLQGVTLFAPLFEAISSSLVGNRRRFAVGRHAGPFIIQKKLEEMGIKAKETQITEILTRVKEAMKNRKVSLSEDEFAAIVQTVFPRQSQK